MSIVTRDVPIARAQQVTISEDALTVDLQDGRTIIVPLTWYPRLVNGTPQERQHWRLMGDGVGIHWPDLDEDIKVEHLLSGKASNESQTSLQRWLAQRTTPPLLEPPTPPY
ncbi:DUF2442 domain-containing protein [Candidatus Viridilinea mediisalina]|uniref:DUF2442 domain-containing protein n=1 Tax=Candidatus Viridilinea mediisalina TaxID=2024553 RepID=A0A2A6RIJ8_9CHLR|nr:DUF2442 domain-containing protein [Candidatus Viridilinea mediisalina]PDW02709.1 hypothetical protein CJ255_12690 [Candidatus Viridilinea mediisalina]